MSIDREQFERLLTERADGVLTPEQLAELDRAMAGSSEFADLARGYERLQAVLRRWRALPSDINWQGLSARISRSVGDEVGLSASKTVDDLVQDAFGPMPEVDWPRLKARISAAVRNEAASQRNVATQMTRRSWSRTVKWMATVGAPLAAAAVIVLAIWSPWSAIPTAPPPPTPSQSMVVVSFETPEPTGQVKITFEEKPYKGPVEDETNGAAIANGPSQVGTRERVDEVVLY